MSLLEIRRRFVKEFTGRYDLIIEGSDFEDNGANFFIQQGQRWLERQVTHKKAPASVYAEITLGDFSVIFQEARSVLSVWESTVTYGRHELTKLTPREARELYPAEYSHIANAGPRYYVPLNFRTSPADSDSFTIDQIGDILYTSDLGGDYSYNGIIILPPTDIVRTIEVVGLFFLPTLVNDTDRNYWTENEPMLLLQAAARAHEIALRNTQGVLDYERPALAALTDLDKDFVEEEIADIARMEG